MMASNLPKTYKAVFFEKANSPMVLKDVELKLPKPGQILVKTLACGVCHSDVLLMSGALGDLL